MSLGQEILKVLAVPSLCRCLSGREEDLRRLLVLDKIPFPSHLLRAFLGQLSRDLEAGGGIFSNLLLRIGRQANPIVRRRLVRNLIFHWGVKGAAERTRIRETGCWVPFVIAISPTMRCNLSCRGCYAGLYSKDGELSEVDLDRLLDECRTIGNYFVVLTGGEPYLLKDTLLRLFRKYSDMYFLTFTNGTRIDDNVADELARLGNVAPAISLEGFEAQTDARRGPGVFARATAAMERLRRRGVLFGISVTYASDNIGIVTEDRFIEDMIDRGALFAWYFMFVPVGKDPILSLVPSAGQRLECGRRVNAMRRKYGLFIADFWNDGPAVAGCLAGARRYMHILNSGRVEACVFAHFGVDNIREKSLLQAANSPFFSAIRNAFPFNEVGNLKRPCILTDNPRVLRDLVREYVPDPGHAHSEDLVSDPAVMAWVDDYAERWKELTESEWVAAINNPCSRWYREKEEYQNLFTFGKMRGEPPKRRPQSWRR